MSGTGSTKDFWKISVDTIGVNPDSEGLPPALVNLEIKISRRIVIPTSIGESGQIRSALNELGLDNVYDLVQKVRALPLDIRSVIGTDWREAADGQFSATAIAKLSEAAERKMTWKVVGDFSPTGTCEGIINCGGYEIRLPISRSNVGTIEARLIQQRDAADAVIKSQASSDAEKKAAKVAFDAAVCAVGVVAVAVGGARDPLTILGVVSSCWAAYDAMVAAKTEAEKKAAEKQANDSRLAGERDAPEGAGEGFRKEGDRYIG